MKLRSGKTLSSELSDVFPSSKNEPRKFTSEVVKKSRITKQRNKPCSSSDSSSETLVSDSSDDTFSVSPKSKVGTKSSKVVPLKRHNIQGGNTLQRKSTRKSNKAQSIEDNEKILFLGDNLKRLSITVSEDSVVHPAETKVKVVKHGLKLSKKTLCRSVLPFKQTCSKSNTSNDLAVSQNNDSESTDTAAYADIQNYTQEKNSGQIFSQRNVADGTQNEVSKPKLPLKCGQLKCRSKLLGASMAGTVKCATSIKPLVTKTLSGNTSKVVPVIYIESSSSSEDEGCDGSNTGGSVGKQAVTIGESSVGGKEVSNNEIKPEINETGYHNILENEKKDDLSIESLPEPALKPAEENQTQRACLGTDNEPVSSSVHHARSARRRPRPRKKKHAWSGMSGRYPAGQAMYQSWQSCSSSRWGAPERGRQCYGTVPPWRAGAGDRAWQYDAGVRAVHAQAPPDRDARSLPPGAGMQNPVSSFGGNVYLPSSQPVCKRGLRPVIIDGSNVAMGHGGNGRFSYRGLQICVDYFVRRGHKVVAFLPHHRRAQLAAKDRLVLRQLERAGHVVFTPSRWVDNRLVVPYDDWYIVQCAAVLDGVIVSNDNYRDLLAEDVQMARTIKERLLMFTWVDNLLMFPRDPLGRNGPSLDQFLSFPAS
ncbi:uncharacterized protein LOC134532478 [Bacillus rossius redtenbacheri]|uniref:uncharacterized protein LOC134532478 n=1 Tax=Bacillus rossius redtenbacheri TaxID=93214 RepID=UPI002FDD7A60